ncbi:MAG: hypothetical protein K2G19_13135, partial [Lachnospiraceae bacterium]|nr:hypothetical protein [Lachnospiraceae bacterium]
ALPIVFSFGISGPAFVCALLYNKTFKRFEPAEEITGDEEWTVIPEEGAETETVQPLMESGAVKAADDMEKSDGR